MKWLSAIAFVALGLGCNGGCGSSSVTPAPDNSSTSQGESEAPEPGEAPGATNAPAAATNVRFRVAVEHSAASPVLENHGTANVRIRKGFVLEREQGGRFAPQEGAGPLSFRARCDDDPPACIPLAPGAMLAPPGWNGQLGDSSQCRCPSCPYADSGTYRFAATTCDGARIESEPFVWSR